MSVRIDVPGGGPLFEGHFPGRPILPGVAGLSMVARALAPAEGPTAVRAIPFLRFRGLVMPSDALEVSAAMHSTDGALRFEVRRAGGLMANGAILFGPPIRAASRGMSVGAPGPRGVPPLDALIPHRSAMRFVERIVGEASDGATCLARIPGACALVMQGEAPAFVALEVAAQTAALWEALRRARAPEGAQARIGYLVSVRDVTLHRETIPADADLFASIRLEALAAPLATYAVEVVTQGEVALRGTIGTYLSG